MAESTSTFNTPQLWINTYLQEKLAEIIVDNPNTPQDESAGIGIPFLPSKPASIDELTEQWVIVGDQRIAYSGVMAVWDRLVRMRRSPFPHIKQEQLLYYFYATEEYVTEVMVQVQEAVFRLMDREDESAEELNNWAKSHAPISGMTCKFKFHRFKIYQLEEVRDIIDFGTARTYGGNKIIIDFEYHQDNSIVNP